MSNVVQLNQHSLTPHNTQTNLFHGKYLPTVAVGDHDLIIREYYSQRVVTFDAIDKLHNRPYGTARRNFSTNKKHFIEGVDYYSFKGTEGREALIDGNYTNFVELPKSNNFSFHLFTQTGYLMLVKSLQDDLAWIIQRELITGYFAVKNLPGNIFDVMRQTINILENNQKTMDETRQQLDFATEKLMELDERTNITIHPTWIQAHQVARHLALFSLTNKPHSAIIASIAKQLGFRTNVRNWYEDDYIAVAAKQENDTMAWEIFYKPPAVSRIFNWWNTHKDSAYFVEYYKKDSRYGKAGDIRIAGYRIGGIKYITKRL